jgi:hypothetical protein
VNKESNLHIANGTYNSTSITKKLSKYAKIVQVLVINTANQSLITITTCKLLLETFTLTKSLTFLSLIFMKYFGSSVGVQPKSAEIESDYP